MKTGMMAAEEIFAKFKEKDGEIGGIQLENLQKKYEKSWVHDELYQSRNFKSGFGKGLFGGLIHGGLTQHITKGKEPWTLAHRTRDSETT
jgi:electron-transferring-flavoprotein dehydrogenase